MKFDKLRERLLEAITRAGRKGLSTPELAKRLRLPRHRRASPRCSELRQLGKIGERGKRKNHESGEGNGIWVSLKYLSLAEKRHEKQLRDLWDIRRQINRLMARLPLGKKLKMLKSFFAQLSQAER